MRACFSDSVSDRKMSFNPSKWSPSPSVMTIASTSSGAAGLVWRWRKRAAACRANSLLSPPSMNTIFPDGDSRIIPSPCCTSTIDSLRTPVDRSAGTPLMKPTAWPSKIDAIRTLVKPFSVPSTSTASP